jgi:hypothetical protein
VKYMDHDTGLVVTGTTGSVFIYGDGGSGYEVFDVKGARTGVFKDDATQFSDKFDGDVATAARFANLIGAIRKGDKLHAPISEGNIVVTMLHLSNISWELNRELRLKPPMWRMIPRPWHIGGANTNTVGRHLCSTERNVL